MLIGRTYLGRNFEFALRLGDGNAWIADVGDAMRFASLDVDAQVRLEIDPANVIVFAHANSGSG
jgi:hypothetical protein